MKFACHFVSLRPVAFHVSFLIAGIMTSDALHMATFRMIWSLGLFVGKTPVVYVFVLTVLLLLYVGCHPRVPWLALEESCRVG
jgi:hypothetical protein